MVDVSGIMYQDMKKLQLLKISLVGTWAELLRLQTRRVG